MLLCSLEFIQADVFTPKFAAALWAAERWERPVSPSLGEDGLSGPAGGGRQGLV